MKWLQYLLLTIYYLNKENVVLNIWNFIVRIGVIKKYQPSTTSTFSRAPVTASTTTPTSSTSASGTSNVPTTNDVTNPTYDVTTKTSILKAPFQCFCQLAPPRKINAMQLVFRQYTFYSGAVTEAQRQMSFLLIKRLWVWIPPCSELESICFFQFFTSVVYFIMVYHFWNESWPNLDIEICCFEVVVWSGSALSWAFLVQASWDKTL